MAKYLDSTGLVYFWSKIKTWVGNYAKIANGKITIGSNEITPLTSHQDISGKVDKTTTVNGHALSSNVTITASDIGLESVLPSCTQSEANGNTLSGTYYCQANKTIYVFTTYNENKYRISLDQSGIHRSGWGTNGWEASSTIGLITNVETSRNSVTLLTNYDPEDSEEVVIPAATNTTAGVIVADDYAKLNSLPNNVKTITSQSFSSASSPLDNGIYVFSGGGLLSICGNYAYRIQEDGVEALLWDSTKSKYVSIGNIAELTVEADTNSVHISSNISATDTSEIDIDAASTTAAGVMSAADKTKLNGVATGAQVNVIESVQLDGTALTVTNKTVNIQLKKGAANGICPLDANAKIASQYLPSYVDDVIEAYARTGQTALTSTWLATGSASGTTITPEAGKIYVLMADSGDYTSNSQFRWGGSAYVKLNDGGVSAITTTEIDTIVAN